MPLSRPSLAPALLTLSLVLLLVAAPARAAAGTDPYPAELLEEYPEGIEQVEVEEIEHLYIGYDKARPLRPAYVSNGASSRESAAARLLESANVAIPRGFDPVVPAAAEPLPTQAENEVKTEAGLIARAPAGLAAPVAHEGFPLRRSETASAVREYVKAFEGAEPSLFSRVRGAHWRAMGAP